MSETIQLESIIVVTYNKQYKDVFDRLNREWLEHYGLYEEEDGKYLEHPEEMIIDKGGEIFFALKKGEVVGTCAVIPYKADVVELAKLAVDNKVQGQGIGRRLTETVIDWARDRKCQKVILVSSTKLRQALHLYEKLGFLYGSLPDDISYETADIYMELSLS
ncbi:MAG: transcriptional regulator [bacterium]|nr:MAG: transcriptional regulator [bacterium]